MPKPEIGITVDARELRRAAKRFGSLGRSQLPFATAKALTQTAKDARDAVQRQLPQSFEVRNRGLKRAITFQGAKKRDDPQTAYVGTRPWADFLTLHAIGGVKRGQRGHRLAIPTRVVRRTASGRVRKSQKPRVLRSRRGFAQKEVEGPRGQIAVRTKRNRGRAIFFILRRRARIRKSWPFETQVQKSVRVFFPMRFRRALRDAVATAKRR